MNNEHGAEQAGELDDRAVMLPDHLAMIDALTDAELYAVRGSGGRDHLMTNFLSVVGGRQLSARGLAEAVETFLANSPAIRNAFPEAREAFERTMEQAIPVICPDHEIAAAAVACQQQFREQRQKLSVSRYLN